MLVKILWGNTNVTKPGYESQNERNLSTTEGVFVENDQWNVTGLNG